jgi:hypothetical protein
MFLRICILNNKLYKDDFSSAAKRWGIIMEPAMRLEGVVAGAERTRDKVELEIIPIDDALFSAALVQFYKKEGQKPIDMHNLMMIQNDRVPIVLHGTGYIRINAGDRVRVYRDETSFCPSRIEVLDGDQIRDTYYESE